MMDTHDLLLKGPAARIGHNLPPEPLDAIAALRQRLDQTYHDLVARFVDLELGCTRVPDPIANAEEAGLVTDFIAQCQAQLRRAENTHKEEKAPYLTGGRTVDAFFKRRCDKLAAALVPVIDRLKAYRDRLTAVSQAQHEAARQTSADERDRALAEAAQHRAAAERLAGAGQGPAGRQRAADHMRLADAAEERAREAERRLALGPEAVRIEGDYGAVAYATRSWSYEVLELAAVPRDYLTLDTERVRTAITKEGVREIPGLRIYEREELRVRGAP